MFDIRSVQMRVTISACAALMMLAGCATTTGVTPASASPVDEMPLLVRFDERPCPVQVIEVVDSCSVSAPDKVCRKRNQKITWLAVTNAVPPYAPSLENFTIEFGPDPAPPPPPVLSISSSPLKETHCKESDDGFVSCRIRGTAPHGSYYYKIVGDHGCELDPRVYVN